MARTAAGEPGKYRSAGWIRDNLHVNECTMLRLVAFGKVRVHAADCSFPLYAIEDVRTWLKERDNATQTEKYARRRPAAV